MDEGHLPPELERIERILASDARFEPPAALRWRVLDAMRAEMCCQPGRNTRRRWQIAAAIAASILAMFGIASMASQLGLVHRPPDSPPSVQQVADRLQELSPGMSREASLERASYMQITAGVGFNFNNGRRSGAAAPTARVPSQESSTK